MEYLHVLEVGGYAARTRDLWRGRDHGQRFASICVVDNLARLFDRRKSVVIIKWKRAGKDLKLFCSQSRVCCINSGYRLSF